MRIKDLDISKKDFTSPKDRLPMIKEAFKLVMNREPSSRELSFYKYGVQTKQEIIEKLLTNDEHKDAFKKAKDFPKIEERCKDAELKVSKLKQKIEDSKQEELCLKTLLGEKNREIAILRKEKEDPYNFTHSHALKYIKGLTENGRDNINNSTQKSTSTQVGGKHFSSISSTPIKSKETFIDKIYRLLKF